ncbi:MAG TPA: isocitrate lyase/PEP mutase family protein [Stellaceae bacterium]|nr:isocitrate lyase/PEP mutase family protein [Stellaceae bacterium]
MASNAHDMVREKRVRFRALLRRKALTLMPGGFSPLYARMAQEAGFESFFLAGSQLSSVLYGVPDNGIIGLRDLVDHARHMAARTDIPILVDADTGFGNAINVFYAVQEIVRSGVAALQIEDQEAPKKSGTAAGRRLIPLEEAVGKIKAAVAARDAADPEFAICARCDGIGAEGGSFDDTLRRCVAYVAEGGADLVWLNSVETREQLRRACAEIPAPVLVIWGGPEPAPSPEEYADAGVRIALYPTFTSTYAIQAVWQLLNEFRERGPVALAERVAAMKESRWGLADPLSLTGARDIRALEERFLPAAARRDYEGTWGHRPSFERDPKP